MKFLARLPALGGGQDAVVIRVHLVEMRQKRGFELLPGDGLNSGESVLQKAQCVPADSRREIAPGRGTQEQQFRAKSRHLLSRHDAVMVEVELIESLIRALACLLPGETRLLRGIRRRLAGLDGAQQRRRGRERCAEGGGGDEHPHGQA